MKIDRLLLIFTTCLIIVGMIFSILYIFFHGKYTPVFVKTTPVRQIVIDAGHGGEDSGAVVGDILEKDINLKISLILNDLLTISGFDTIMTRTEDISIYDEGSNSLRSKKRSDLMNRLKMANKNENAIVVSIHQNKFHDSKYFGAQVFYGNKNTYSKSLAESLQCSIVNMLQPENKRNIKPVTKSVYLINNAKTPAVLCECGFISNKKDASLLIDEDYQKKMAFAIYNGILNFYNS
ncbi:MAG: N-acetylmuramoyl-L-alanine amidase [Oscillospiraceae bacterium]|nr:N-acetylmuramoyl-L-alanine amidase [Oscillospiraceae bacterium]